MIDLNTAPETLAAEIRWQRKLRDWSIPQMAKLADLSPDTVSRVEQGQGATHATLLKLQKLFEEQPIPGEVVGLVREIVEAVELEARAS